MQRFLSKYGAATHLALLAVASLFLCPICQQETIATVLLWLSIPTLIWALMSPSCRRDEYLHEARARVLKGFLKDPIFWILFSLTIIAFIRFLNDGVKIAYNAEIDKWNLMSPSLEFLPGSVTGEGYLPFATLFALTVLFIGCRYSLGKKARVSFFIWTSVFSSISALTFAVMFFYKSQAIIELTKCSILTSSYCGVAFGLSFLGGIVALIGMFLCRWTKWLLPIAFSTMTPLLGLYFFAPLSTILLYILFAIIIVAVSSVYGVIKIDTRVAFKFLACILIGLSLPILVIAGVVTDDINASRYTAIINFNVSLFDDSFFQLRSLLSKVAIKSWEENAWLGSGLGSFPFALRFNLMADDFDILKGAHRVVLNGYYHLLVERGILGALSYLSVVLGFIVVYVIRLIKTTKKLDFLPGAILGPLAIIILSVEAITNVSFLRADVTLIAGSYLFLACSSFPNAPKKEEE